MLPWKALILTLCLLTFWSPALANDNRDGLSLTLTGEWRETPYQKGWVVTAELTNRGEAKTIPAQTCVRVPWASVLELRFRSKGEIREQPVSFIDIRSVHTHGPFSIDKGETLSQDIWLEDPLSNVGLKSTDDVQVAVKLQASGEAVWTNPPVGSHDLGSLNKVWNGTLHSNWVKLKP